MGTIYKRPGSPNWQADYTDHTGKRIKQRSTRTRSKPAAYRILAKWEADEALKREGVVDPAAERLAKQRTRQLKDHLKEFERSISSANQTEKHVNATIDAVSDAATVGNWASLGDINAEDVELYMSQLRDADAAARTIQRKVNSVKQFSKWCYETGRIQTNILARVKTPNPDTDRRLERRALLPEEWPILLKTTVEGEDHACGVTGPQRGLLYSIALQTGLRSNELRSLTLGKLHLDKKPPFVLVPSRSTKNKKPARQYLTQTLAGEFQDHAKSRPHGSPLFDLPHETDMALMLRQDLENARRDWIASLPKKEQKRSLKSDFLAATNHEGLDLDFHALRHTCGAWLAASGENPKTIQVIMRHSSITLTMDTYGHLFPAVEADAIGRLGNRYFEPD